MIAANLRFHFKVTVVSFQGVVEVLMMDTLHIINWAFQTSVAIKLKDKRILLFANKCVSLS